MGPWGPGMPVRPEQAIQPWLPYGQDWCDCETCGDCYHCSCDCPDCDCRYAERMGS